MKPPRFPIILAAALLVLGAFLPLASSALAPSLVAKDTLAGLVVPILVLAALLVVASSYRRSKAEMVGLGVIAAIIPHAAKFLGEAKIIATPYLPDASFHFTTGAFVIWVAAALVIISTLMVKSDEA
jgi:hypothetical protein